MGVTLRFALYVFVIMTCAASVVMAQTPEPPQDQARNTLNQGVSAFRNGNYDVAIEYFKRAVELDPDFVDGQLYLATAYAQRYRPGGTQPPENDAFATNAIDWFKRVLARDPGNIAAYLGIASIYQNSQKFENAREAYLTLTKLDPQNPISFYSLGSIDWLLVYDKKNPLPLGQQALVIDEGLHYLDAALALNPQFDDAMTYENLLFREKARLAVDPAEKARLTALADQWFERSIETRKRNAEQRGRGGNRGGTTGTGFSPPPPPPPPR